MILSVQMTCNPAFRASSPAAFKWKLNGARDPCRPSPWRRKYFEINGWIPVLSQIFLLYSFVGIDLDDRSVARMRKELNVLTCLNIDFDHLVFFLSFLKGLDQLANIVEYVTDFIFNSDVFCFLINDSYRLSLLQSTYMTSAKNCPQKTALFVKLLVNPGGILIYEPIIFVLHVVK